LSSLPRWTTVLFTAATNPVLQGKPLYKNQVAYSQETNFHWVKQSAGRKILYKIYFAFLTVSEKVNVESELRVT
jgi:hypothetical protein